MPTGLLCPQMINARTTLHIAPWWCRPVSASIPTTQPPVAALAPMSWSVLPQSLPEMGPRDSLLMVSSSHYQSPTHQPTLYPPALQPALVSSGMSPRVVEGGKMTVKMCGWVCVWCDGRCAHMPHIRIGGLDVCAHTHVLLLKTRGETD